MECCLAGLKIVENNKPVPLKSIEVDVTVKGFIANVTSRLVFKNTEANPIEAVYEFPIDDQSAVYHFEAEIDGRIIIAECQEKKQAKETYDEAVSHGFTATLLEEDATSSDIFRCLVGNLPANTDAVIKFSYVTELALQPDGVLQFTLPTLLNPRYNPKLEDGGAIKPPDVSYVPDTKPQPYTFTFKARVINSTAILSVSSSKDELSTVFNDDRTEAEISLLNAFKADHDVTLSIAYQEPFKPHVVTEAGQDSKDGLLKQDVLMLNFFPEITESDRSSKHEFIFVIDRSGSMQGSRILGAQETLLLFLKSLPPGCYFNIIGFGSHFTLLFPEGSREYSEASLEAAIVYQKTMYADFGGTEILRPLESIFAKSPMTTHSRQIFLMTDGAVHNTNAVIDLVQKNASNTRVFTFGIGEGASTALVQGVARAGRGTAEFVKEKQRMQPLVMKTLKSAMQAAVTDLHLDWLLGGAPALIQVPQQMPPLFGGSRLIVYAISPSKTVLDGQVQLKGKIGSRLLEFTINIEGNKLTTSSDASLPIHRLAAKAQIQQLQDQEKNDTDKNKAAIILLSTAANVVSRHTSMVGVDRERPDKITGDMIQRRVPMMHDPTLSGAHYMHTISSTRSRGAFPMVMSSSLGGSARSRGAMPLSRNCAMPTSYEPARSLVQRGENFYSDMHVGSCGPPAPPPTLNAAPPSGLVFSSAFATRAVSAFSQSDKMEFSRAEVKQPDKKPDYMDVVSLQLFSGSWKLSVELASLIGKSIDVLQASALIKSENVWATVLALALLAEKFADQKEEWEMIEMKALQWLAEEDLEGHELATLMTKAREVITQPK